MTFASRKVGGVSAVSAVSAVSDATLRSVALSLSSSLFRKSIQLKTSLADFVTVINHETRSLLMPAFLLNARTREVFGSALNLSDLDVPENPAEILVAPLHKGLGLPPLRARVSSRDAEVFEIEAAIELAAEDVKIPRTFFPLQTRLSARDQECFEPEDLMARDEEEEAARLSPIQRFSSARDMEVFESYEVKEIPSHELGPVALASQPSLYRGVLSARDKEVCDEAAAWVGVKCPGASGPVVARRASGRDGEY